MGILRSNPKIKIDPKSGEVLFDQEALTVKAINNKVKELGKLAFPLGQHYIQLIHWAPFDTRPKFHPDPE